jgi:hypothetical protein
MPATLKQRWLAWLLLLLLQPFAHAHENTTPVVIGVFSAYQSDVISHKIDAFVEGIAQTLQHPVYVKTVGNSDALRQLLIEQRLAIVFLPHALLAPGSQLIPLAQTDVPLALYARPGTSTLADLKTVSIPESVSSAELIAELNRLNPKITVVREPIGVQQLRSLVSGEVDGAVMSVGLFNNLAPSLRNNYDKRYSFVHRQRILALCTAQFSHAQRERLTRLLLTLPPKAHDQVRQTFGISGFEGLIKDDVKIR